MKHADLVELEKKVAGAPWEILEGGNFVRIGENGYCKHCDEQSYMGGPLSVAELEYSATEDYSHNHALAMRRARLIAALRNAAPAYFAVVEKANAHIAAYGKYGPGHSVNETLEALREALAGLEEG